MKPTSDLACAREAVALDGRLPEGWVRKEAAVAIMGRGEGAEEVGGDGGGECVTWSCYPIHAPQTC